ncbi:MAG: efflux RND transporter permease subunit, partial [Anaerolineales bacterium]|nr:efflux RND transporter permease subunit [Anaerolineales bacterium]
SGQDQADSSLMDFILAATLGLVLIFVIMGVLFESFMMPLAIIMSVPFLFVGSYWFMYISGGAMGETAFVGFIILLGVVVNNAIVLVDTINRFRAKGANRQEAILQAGAARLRPILMTALTTICGLVPLVVLPSTGEGLDYRPLATVIMGGLMSSTAFTLLVVPLFYVLLDSMRENLRGTFLRYTQASSPRS